MDGSETVTVKEIAPRIDAHLKAEVGRMNPSTGRYWDVSWNPIVGCSPVSAGCEHCWAAAMGRRQTYSDLVTNGAWNGQVRFLEKVLEAPLHWRKPRVVAVGWMGDMFHPNIPDEWIARVFVTMRHANHHRYLVLTKRPDRMADLLVQNTFWELCERFSRLFPSCRFAEYFPVGHLHYLELKWTCNNLWLGTSAENQATLDKRLPELFRCGPGWKYWLSLEPLLGLVDVAPYLWSACPFDDDTKPRWDGLSGVILGGETGPGARPMHPDRARKVRDDCAAAGVPFFFKGWGQWAPHRHGDGHRCQDKSPCTKTDLEYAPRGLAGRSLDGREHNELGWGKS